ncbi:MAG TPA: tetratricopeptide repeat protein [Longimicrobium sp.]
MRLLRVSVPPGESRRFLLRLFLALGACVGVLPAAAQGVCTPNSRAEPPHLDAFAPLFRQNGVSFHARVDTDAATTGGRLVIGNGNPYDVELTYDVVVAGSAGVETAEGRCVQIRAREYAVDTDASTVFRYEKGTPTGVRVRNLRMTRVEAAPSADATTRAAAAPSPAAPAQLTQYRCGEGGTPGQRACSTAFMAAAARAAAESGSFAGVTRECLLEYATVQETAAHLIRASDAGGDSLRLTTPPCYSRGEARWGYDPLAAACPRGEWTSGNAGRVDCAAPAVVAAPDSAPAAPAAGETARQALAAGLLLLEQGKAAEAEAELRRALSIAPADAVLHANLGTALAQQRRWSEAEAAYRAAVWLDPSNARFRGLLRQVARDAAVKPRLVASGFRAPPPAPSAEPARSVDIPRLIVRILGGVIMVAMSAAGAVLLLPVLSALCLALAWGGSRLLRLNS